MLEIGFFNYFLSHLCGEEDFLAWYAASAVFLSHLCGEEVFSIPVRGNAGFLSHLCGEEGHH